VRALSATNLHLRCNNITCEDVDDSPLTYVLAKNVLRRFINIADIRTQVSSRLSLYSLCGMWRGVV
jgi:pre-mRNA-processing factor 8